MHRLMKSHFIKTGLGTVFLFLCAVVLGLLFSRFSSIHYLAEGISGTVTSADVTFSLVFIVFALLFHFVCGLCDLPGARLGIAVLAVCTVGLGLVGFLGYAWILGPVFRLYFVLIAPISALLESLFALSPNADFLFVLLPAVLILGKAVSFGIGRRLHRRPELLERSLRRIDRFYEYRRPVEEDTLDSRSA